MIIIKGFDVRNFRVRHAHLQDLRDLNIVIGPNNCGKTNILTAINLLSKVSTGYGFSCPECGQIGGRMGINGVVCPVTSTDKYLHREREEFDIGFSFNEKEVEKLVPDVLGRVRKDIEANGAHCVDELRMKGTTAPGTEHISPFIHKDIIEELKTSVLFCPEQRLESYRGENLPDYIRDKGFSGAQGRKWDKFVRELVEPKLIDHSPYTLNLIKDVKGTTFETPLQEQGSGVRSLACLVADIISEDKAKIILIDEPELGLNPFAKQELLKFLLSESKSKQVFIATHDPTFVSPPLWKDDAVAVFFYSVMKEEFVKIDLKQSHQSPASFAGYLPHTTSLRDIHIYVEGDSDVYIFQIFVRRHLNQRYQNWAEFLNKVGIFHLAGDFWQHLLYTIPRPPYKCIVILDGGKRDGIESVLDKYSEASENVPEFEFAEDIDKLSQVTQKSDRHPVYCLTEKCIEEYLDPKPNYKAPGYSKKLDGPRIAEDMQTVPEEIERLLEIILKPSDHAEGI